MKHRDNITTFTILEKVPSFKGIQIHSGAKPLPKADFPEWSFMKKCVVVK
jgi:hypothetical protein